MITLAVALIVAAVGIVAAVLARESGKRFDMKEQRDNERADAIEAKVSEVARLMSDSRETIGGQLREIHSLVNSDMTSMMEALCVSLKAQVVMTTSESERDELRGRIFDLETKLADRFFEATA